MSIQKFDSNFIIFPDLKSNLYTLEYNDLIKPVYIFLSNMPDHDFYKGQLKFYVQVHSGQFIGSYRDSLFKQNDSIYEGLINFSLNSEVELPMKTINIVKLQCLKSGIITLYYLRENLASFYQGTNINYYIHQISYTYGYYKLTNYYFQVFTITGESEVDLTNIKGDKYKNSFYKKIYYPYSAGRYIVNVRGTRSLMISIVNVGENNKTLEKENEDIYMVKSGEIIYISLGYDKKSINISSNISGFYWTYEFSQTDDINYLPRNTYGLSNYEIGNTTYIKNPHYFKPNNTYYFWFITLKHLHNESVDKFTYEYISDKDSEIENNKMKINHFLQV